MMHHCIPCHTGCAVKPTSRPAGGVHCWQPSGQHWQLTSQPELCRVGSHTCHGCQWVGQPEHVQVGTHLGDLNQVCVHQLFSSADAPFLPKVVGTKLGEVIVRVDVIQGQDKVN